MADESVYYSGSEAADDSGLDNAVLVETDGVIWDNDCSEITIYADGSDGNITLTADNDSDTYVSANEGSSSRFFSVLGSEDDEGSGNENLDDMQVEYLETNDKEEEEVVLAEKEQEVQFTTKKENDHENMDSQVNDVQRNQSPTPIMPSEEDKVILYRMENSDEMYAVQVADDGNGNLQRYQYKVRQNADGQLEAVPGTIELQVEDTLHYPMLGHDASRSKGKEPPENKQNRLNNVNVPMPIIKEDVQSDVEEEIVGYEEATETYDEVIARHETVQDEGTAAPQVFDSKHSENETGSSSFHNSSLSAEVKQEIEAESEEEIFESNACEQIHNETEEPNEVPEASPAPPEPSEERHVEEEPESSEAPETEPECNIENRPPIILDPVNTSQYTQVQDHKNVGPVAYVLSQVPSDMGLYNSNPVQYILVAKSKEDVTSPAVKQVPKSNPRSLLKRNVIQENKIAEPPKQVASILTKKPVEKTKEVKSAIRAKVDRQPRKQKIKPIERQDNEIIVQPMSYPAGEVCYKENVPVVINASDEEETVVLSDDTETSDSDVQQGKRRRVYSFRRSKRKKSLIEITISDSESDSECEYISETRLEKEVDKAGSRSDANKEINSAPLSERAENNSTYQKRIDSNKDGVGSVTAIKTKTNDQLNTKKRKMNKTPPGRTPKRTIRSSVATTTAKRNTPVIKKALHTHSFKRRSFNLRDSSTKSSNLECRKCKLTFKSPSQLNRHNSVHTVTLTGNMKCVQCQIVFKNRALYMDHKREHVKENLVNDKTTGRVLRPSTVNKVEKQDIEKKTDETKELEECKLCGKKFRLLSMLMRHRLAHKNFKCTNCDAAFAKNVLLEEHKQTCTKAKNKSPIRNTRASVMLRSSFKKPMYTCIKCKKTFLNQTNYNSHVKIHESERKPLRKSTVEHADESTGNTAQSQTRRQTIVKLECESCKQVFATNTGLIKHTLTAHKKENVDGQNLNDIVKNVRKKLPRTPHGGIPAVFAKRVFNPIRVKT